MVASHQQYCVKKIRCGAKIDRSKSRKKTTLTPKGKGFGQLTGTISQLTSEHKTS